MPAKVTQSGLLKKYGGRIDAAVKKYADAEPNYGFQRLPGGITNGIAQLVECGFGKVEQGKANARYIKEHYIDKGKLGRASGFYKYDTAAQVRAHTK